MAHAFQSSETVQNRPLNRRSITNQIIDTQGVRDGRCVWCAQAVPKVPRGKWSGFVNFTTNHRDGHSVPGVPTVTPYQLSKNDPVL